MQVNLAINQLFQPFHDKFDLHLNYYNNNFGGNGF